MKSVSAAISSYLNGFPNQLLMADAYLFNLQNGSTLAYTNAQMPFTLGTTTYQSVGPLLQRSSIRSMRGVEVDTLDIAVADNGTTSVAGSTFLQALRNGLLDGAVVTLYRIFFTAPGVPVQTAGSGDLILFYGRVGEIDVGRFQATIRCNSHLAQLNIQMPRNQFQPGCVNTLYDAGCGLTPANFAVVSSATAGSSSSLIYTLTLSQSPGYFDQGVIAFTTGANAGYSRTVRSYIPGLITPSAAFPNPIIPGDTFTIRPGCDKSQATCSGKFNNLIRFRGFPYVPVVTAVVSY
jgi:uncharacterized phage protein (TIGR02218 family)